MFHIRALTSLRMLN